MVGYIRAVHCLNQVLIVREHRFFLEVLERQAHVFCHGHHLFLFDDGLCVPVHYLFGDDANVRVQTPEKFGQRL
jgi:hypothetical protein